MWEEFKKFILRGNVMDMAVGIVVGAAFTAIVKSLVDNIIMPPLGLLIGGIDFSAAYIVLKQPAAGGPFATPEDLVKAGGVLLRYGLVLNAVISFLILATVIFLVIKGINKLTVKPVDPTTKDCPKCQMAIPLKAVRCGHCTSELA